MELKKIILAIFLVGFISSANAEIIKPAENLSAYDVIKIQLNALKNNDDKDNGIKQTWIFAHPDNKKNMLSYFENIERINRKNCREWVEKNASTDIFANKVVNWLNKVMHEYK